MDDSNQQQPKAGRAIKSLNTRSQSRWQEFDGETFGEYFVSTSRLPGKTVYAKQHQRHAVMCPFFREPLCHELTAGWLYKAAHHLIVRVLLKE
jgi:hypothetical protein